MSRTVLVTGGAGFVGSYVVRDLLAGGNRVVVYDLATTGNALDLVLPEWRNTNELRVEAGSILDGWRLQRLCRDEGVDSVVHLASPLTEDVLAEPIAGIRAICEGTGCVFEAARALPLRRVVWASSVAVFGWRQMYPDGPIANDAPHRPQSLYGSCKSLCERMALDYRQSYGVDSVALRLTVVYGAARLRGYMTFPSDIIRSVALGLPVRVPLPREELHWQYVEDVSAMVVAALNGPQAAKVAYNTCGDTRTFADAAEILARLAPDAQISLADDDETGDAGGRVLQSAPAAYDDSDFRADFGYEERFPLERGVELAFRAFQEMQGAQQPHQAAVVAES